MTPLGLHHVAIAVDDLDAAIEFYVDRLGLDRRDDRPAVAPPGAWLQLGDQQIHLVAADVGDTGPNHLAILVADLDPVIEELRAGGVRVSDPVGVGAGARQCFLRDPSGNLVELHQRAR